MQTSLLQRRSLPLVATPVVLSAALIAHSLICTAAAGGEGTAAAEQAWKKGQSNTGPATKKFVITKELAVSPGGTLVLQADRGYVEVIPDDVKQVSVEVIRSISEKYAADAEAILKYHEVTISKDGDNAVVKSRLKPVDAGGVNVEGLGFDASDEVQQAIKNVIRRRLKSIHFRVTVPNEYNVNVATGGQSIACGDLVGQARCTTSGGGIKLGRITGLVNATTSGGSLQLAGGGDSVQMKTSGGSIRAGDIDGDAVVETRGGSIDLGRVRGRVSARTSGGSIRITDAGGAVEAITSGGSVSAAISQQPKADSYFATSGGSVRVALAKGLAFDIEHQGKGKASGPFLEKATSGQALSTKLNGGGPKLVTKGNVRFAYLNTK